MKKLDCIIYYVSVHGDHPKYSYHHPHREDPPRNGDHISYK